MELYICHSVYIQKIIFKYTTIMSNMTILSIYCHLKPNQMQEGRNSLFQKAKIMKPEVENDSNFSISYGSPSITSNEASINLSTKVPGANFDKNEARKIADTIFMQLKNYIEAIDKRTSTVVSSFPLCEGDLANEDNEYTYTLEEVLPLNNSNS